MAQRSETAACGSLGFRKRSHQPPLLLLILLLLTFVGCNRAYYRRQADAEAYSLLECGSRDPRWPLNDYTLQPAPQSRLAYPYSPDCPPMTPDDPTAHLLMHCVDCKKGSPCWKHRARTPFADNPYWRAYLPYNDKGQIVLDRKAAVQMSLLHSPDYQEQLENLYLSALVVTSERFQFDVQFFARNETFFETTGRLRGGDSTLSTNTDLGFTKLFAHGGTLIVNFANSLVWQFAGPDEFTAFSLVDFNFVQPLLRGAGREIVLENLTLTERRLLYNIRQMEQFRQGFYGFIVAGRNTGPGPTAGGAPVFVPIGGGLGVGGFLGLLQTQVQIRNQQYNVQGLRSSLEQVAALFEAERLQREQGLLQVEQARQALYGAESTLLRQVTNYQTALDQYKLDLGLPPDLNLQIEDPLLDQFDLISPETLELQDRIETLLGQIRDPRFPISAELLAQLKPLRQEIMARLEEVRQDLRRLEEMLPERRKRLEILAARPDLHEMEIDPSAWSVEALNERYAKVLEDFRILSQPTVEKADLAIPGSLAPVLDALDEFIADPDAAAAAERTPDEPAPAPRRVGVDRLSAIFARAVALGLLQARIRLESVTLVPVLLESDQALQIARRNRLDWMNARGNLVDQWRRIEVVADRLEADLDVTFAGDIGTVDDNPFRFRAADGSLRAGVAFDAPLTRLIERNAYRAELINYARGRRDYYLAVDDVHRSLRLILREMQRVQLDFELTRAAVRNAIIQAELTQLRLAEPPRPGQQTSQGGTATTARDLVDALNALLDARNRLLNDWVGYEALRISLDFELGTMQLDNCGMWLDPGPIEPKETPGSGEKADEDTDGPEIIPPGEETPLAMLLDG